MSEKTFDLIDQEIAGTISDADRDELFEQMMMDPSVADELKRREAQAHQRLSEEEIPKSSRPWLLSNAASLAIGATAAWLVVSSIQEQTPGLASANVYQIDNVRSTALKPPSVFIQTGDPWVTFMAFPFDAVEGITEVDAHIDAFEGEPDTVRSASETEWKSVWRQTSSVGNRDMLLLTVSSDLLQPGIHRLAVYGVVDSEPTAKPVHEVVFDLQFEEE